MPFAYFTPFAETISGALILFGLFTRVGLTLSGLLLIGLTFGVVMLGQAPTVAHNLQYVLLNYVLLWFVDLNHQLHSTTHDQTSMTTNGGIESWLNTVPVIP